MNKVSKVYASKAGANKAMRRKADYLHFGGKSGSVAFGKLFVEGNVLYVQSNHWAESTLKGFLNGKKKRNSCSIELLDAIEVKRFN